MTASCVGPNRDGSVYAGQRVTCTVNPFDGNTFGIGASADLTLTAPPGSVLSSCAGISSPIATTVVAFDALSGRCRFTIASGTLQKPAALGSETITISPGAQTGTALTFSAGFCTAPGPDGERVCTGRPESVPVSGPGSVVSLDPPIVAVGVGVTAIEGQPFTGSVASFSDPDPTSTSSEYSATIDWGDGTSATAGTVAGWSVIGGHVYVEEGSYTPTVTIRDLDSATNGAAASGTMVFPTATIADAPLNATGRAINSTNPFTGVVGSIADANSSGTAADFTATIDWGDGTTSAASISRNNLTFDVTGNHVYAALGPYTILTHVCDDGGACADATSTILVYGLSSGGNFVIGDGGAAVGSSSYYWGAQWASMNSLSGGAAEPSFKGFADDPNAAPDCGLGWATSPGNSATAPDSVPSYMAVTVASSVSKQGPRIGGDSAQVVVIKTDPGYGPAPGGIGSGTVVAVLCP